MSLINFCLKMVILLHTRQTKAAVIDFERAYKMRCLNPAMHPYKATDI